MEGYKNIMNKTVVKQWDKNKEVLREVIKRDKNLKHCYYSYLMKLVIAHILNNDPVDGVVFDDVDFTENDYGTYQGTLEYIIHEKNKPETESIFLTTSVDYGSCSFCDTLIGIKFDLKWDDNGEMDKTSLDDFMTLCLHLCQNLEKTNKEFYPNGNDKGIYD